MAQADSESSKLAAKGRCDFMFKDPKYPATLIGLSFVEGKPFACNMFAKDFWAIHA